MIIHGDCLTEMQRLIDEGVKVDAVVTDPPYHLTSITERFGKEGSAPAQHGTDGAFARASRGFMGKEWDGGDIAFRAETWALCFELLKAGGHLLAFSGSRTYHRMAVAIEDAGFEIRDQIMWIYGSGFPKSHDISKAIDKSLGAKRQIVGTTNILGFTKSSVEQGAQNRTRLVFDKFSDQPETIEAKQWEGWGTALKPAHEPIVLARKPISEKSIADNVVKHGTGALNIDGCRVSLDGEKPPNGSAKRVYKNNEYTEEKIYGDNKTTPDSGRYPANVLHDGLQEEWARYFYCPKTSTAEREESVQTPTKKIGMSGGAQSHGEGYDKAQSIGLNKVVERKNTHPTVKPVELMRYLCRLITPKGGTVLDPFMGSGSTGLAAKTECMEFIGIEREQEYFEIATDRINKTWVQPDMF